MAVPSDPDVFAKHLTRLGARRTYLRMRLQKRARPNPEWDAGYCDAVAAAAAVDPDRPLPELPQWP